MRIVLHIGAWKTGSSAIQTFMAGARDELRAHGVVIPDDATDAKGRNRILQQLSGSDADAAQIMSELTAFKADGAKTLVLSNEHYWPLAQTVIESIGARLKTLSDDVEVLIYVRPQDEMWRSLYAQQAKKFIVKPGAALWGTDDYLAPVFAERALHYHQTLQLFAGVFGQDAITVRHYNRADFVGGDSVTDFLSYLGLDETLFQRQGRDINRSVGWKGVAFALWLADTMLDRFHAQNPFGSLNLVYFRVVNRVAEHFDDQDWIGRSADPLTTADKAEIRAHYAADNERLFQTYFAGRDVFPEPAKGRGDPVSPQAIPQHEMNTAKRYFSRIAQRREYNINGLEPLLAGQAPRRKPAIKRLLNTLPFRAQKS